LGEIILPKKRRKLILSIEDKYKKLQKRFYILLAFFITFISIIAFYIYLNYDYLVFKHFISQHYIYTESLDKLYESQLNRDVDGKYYKYFDYIVVSSVTEKIREINNDKYTYLYTPEQYTRYKIEEKEEADASKFEIINDTTSYIKITNFSEYTWEFMKSKISEIQNYPNLIIDMRNNSGGLIKSMNKMAELFLPKGSIITVDKMRLFNKTYKSKNKSPLSPEKIIILQNRNTASASEGFIAALKDNLDNVLLIGSTTYGKGIGQFTMPLKSGFAVKATTMLWYTPKNINIHKKGIEPDIYYENEDIIDFAVSKLISSSS
jgi:C-terminal processing protease CtpA/Prc